MAEAFYGPHFALACRECGFHFRCGTEYPPTDERATCPNCGCAENEVDAAHPEPGQRVVIDRWSRVVHGVRPWQAIAFHAPHEPEQLTVKRAVAGAAGCVEIRDGDIYLDGCIQQKSCDQFRALAILVHDDQYRSPRGNRWLPATAASRWKATSDGYTASPPSATDSAIDWLCYTQWTCWPGGALRVDRIAPQAILDHDPYNQSLSRGSLHPVPDIMLACRLQMSDAGACRLRLVSRADVFQWELNATTRACQLQWNGAIVATSSRPPGPPPWTVEMAACDHRLMAAIDGAPVFAFDYQPASGGQERLNLQRLAVGAVAGSVALLGPRVYRDVYYLGPGGTSYWRAPQPLEPDEWFVLGDNVPLSVDSRLWSAIDQQSILGPVLPWPH